MNNSPGTAPVEKQQKNLQTDIKHFADGLPHWGKLLAEKILSGKGLADADLNKAYTALLEELKIIPETIKGKIDIMFGAPAGTHHAELRFDELRDAVGVNALAEKQVLKLFGNLTIIYGTNGSGKSGYVRLLKRVFYSKSREDILPNIHLDKGHKEPSAVFVFSAGADKLELRFPGDEKHLAFAQFSVFDGKAAISHLDQKNQLEFRPAGLSFFSEYTEALKKLEAKLQEVVRARQGNNLFPDLFDGDSEIKVLVNGLSANTKMADLQKFLPFTDEDLKKKAQTEASYDTAFIANKGKDKEIAQLQSIKQSLQQTKTSIEKLNKYFSEEALKKIRTVITDCLEKEKMAKQEGIEGFKTELVQAIGSPEWKEFIIASNAFAMKQSKEGAYPTKGDYCLLCHQPLSSEAIKLIQKYWAFIKSEAEKKATEALTQLQQTKATFEKLMFDLLPEGNVLTVWMAEKKAAELEKLAGALNNLKTLCNSLTADMVSKTAMERKPLQVDISSIDEIIKGIDGSINGFKDDAQQKELSRLLGVKTLLLHREKLQQRIADIEKFVNQQVWIKKASNVSWGKRGVTDTEKELSSKYFNQQYINTFNEECKSLDGNFGIQVNHTGAAGASYRQLTLKGKWPSSVLSEGEQKVIAIADFIAEMRMSEINKGLVFDDPVNSLDDGRKKKIAERLAILSKTRQVIIFSHDLVFVSAIATFCEDQNISLENHWIENRDSVPGHLFLLNSPAYEENYRSSKIPRETYGKAKKGDCPPALREYYVKNGFTELRTCYEVLVINELFNNVVQRFNERVSIERLQKAIFDKPLIDELMDGYGLCCRFMEGHSHSNKYGFQKPELDNLNNELSRYEAIRTKIRDMKKML